MQLVSKVARVRIGDDVWQSGDKILLPNITVTLGEDQRSSSCQFSVSDPGLAIGAKYREISVSQGGIIVPPELLSAPTTGAAAASSGATPSTTQLTNYQAGDVVLNIVRECLKQGVSDPTKIAFVLAVAEGESSLRYDAYNPETNNPNVPDKRYGGRGLVQITQKDNYEYFGNLLGVDLLSNPDLAFRPDIATYILVAGLKRGWCGRGGIDRWISSPNSNISAAYRNIQGGVWGDRYQRFFSKWLQQVASLIQQAGGTATATASPPVEPMATATPADTAPTTTQVAPVVESSNKGTEIIIELAVGWGLGFKDAIAFHFIQTSCDSGLDNSGAQITTFGGQSVRWLLTRVPVTESFQSMTFRQYLETRCRQFGLRLDMEGDGLSYQHLSQDGQRHLDVILREARRIGFSIREGTGDRSDTLIVEPTARPTFTNFIIDEEVLISAKFTDKARESRSGQSGATVSSPGTGTGQQTTAIDRSTGSITQASPESLAGSGSAPGATGTTTGATAQPVGGTVQPTTASTAASTTSTGTTATTGTTAAPAGLQNETKAEDPVRTTRDDGAIVTTQRTTSTKVENGKITRTVTTRTSIVPTSGTPTSETREEVAVITDAGKTTTITITPIPGTPTTTTKTEELTAEERRQLELSKRSASQAAAAGATATPGTGLPNQPAGAIDLLDGRAEAQAIADESRRIKGYEDSYTLVLNMDTLAIVPGQIVALSKRLFPDAFATEKRVGSVEHNFGEGTTTLNTYTPQAPPPAASAVTQFAAPAAVNPGGFIFPIPNGATTIGDGYGTRASRPPGYRHTILDITAPGGTVVVAMADGVVSVSPNAGGAGNLMKITHGGGYEATYMHGLAGNPYIVESGQVKQGQPVFRVGTTGQSSGNHLHLKFTLNGNYCLLSKVGLDVLHMGLPIHRYNETCSAY